MSLQDKSQEELKEMFDVFLSKMDDQLDEFIKKAKKQGYKLDFSSASLNDLEKYLLENNTSVNENDFNDSAAYFGEVVRKNYGGKWQCSLNLTKNSIDYGYPVIVGHTKYNLELNPFHAVRSYILRKRPDHFQTVIGNDINPDTLDLSHLPSEKDS
jgi:hypothetical protein